jgi:hypothetical protein
MPEPILRLIDHLAVWLFVIVLIAIPAFAIVAIPHAVKKCAGNANRAGHAWRVRVRIWHLMGAILVAGTLSAIGIMTERAFHAREKAKDHAIQAEACRFALGREKVDLWLFKVDSAPVDGLPGLVAYYESLERYHAAMSQKYYDVASHPWRALSPDPPEPKMPDVPALIGPEYEKMLKELCKLVGA